MVVDNIEMIKEMIRVKAVSMRNGGTLDIVNGGGGNRALL